MDPPKQPTKFRSIRRKKRKGFHGKNRWDKPQKHYENSQQSDSLPGPSTAEVRHIESSVDTQQDSTPQSKPKSVPVTRNISAEKLANSSFCELESEEGKLTRSTARKLGLSTNAEVAKAHGFKLQDASLLSEGISAAAICSFCRKPDSKLVLFQDDGLRNGLAERLFLQCSSCGYRTMLDTSKRTGGKGGGSFEVNRRSVLASIGMGLAGLSKFCGGMNLPPPVTKKAFNEHLIQIEKEATENAEKLLCEAAQRLRALTKAKYPDKIHILDNGNVVADVSVTVDGTWQKRGHSSKHGVVFVISVETGEILDYEVKSLVCKECTSHEKDDKESEEYRKWKDSHASICAINHNSSSEAMETDGAVEIFKRSIEKRNLCYTLFVGDGDSSCYGNVRDAMKGVYEVVKEECVGHVQKRMGTALRKYKKEKKGCKLSDGKSVAGKGRLTDKQVDKIQNYYGEAIRNNPGDKPAMKKAIWAIFYHKIDGGELPLEQQHKFCPKDKDTWCQFWKDKLDGTSKYVSDNRLPEIFKEELKPTFDRLTKEELLDRCLLGLTQNQNEAVNGQLWLNCPKNMFCGKRKIVIAVCETIGVFNTGAASKGLLLKSCGVNPGQNTMKALRKQDSQRLKTTAYKVSEKYQKRRCLLRAKKKSKADKQSYAAGSFGVGSKPEKVNKKKKQTKSKAGSKRVRKELTYSTSADVPLTLAMPSLEVCHVRPLKRTRFTSI